MTTHKTITASIDVAAPRSAVWNALTGPEGVAALFFGCRLVLAPRLEAGAKYEYRGDDGKGNDIAHVVGEVLAAAPNERLVLVHQAGPTWQPGPKTFRSRLSYLLEGEGAATRLRIVQDEIDSDDPGYAHNAEGWPVFAAQVKRFVETGAV